MDWSSKWALYSPDKIAFKAHETGETLTYKELDRIANRLAHRLTMQEQIKKGDRVAVLAENCLEYIALFCAAQKTGFILVPLNFRLSSPEINYLLRDSKPKLVIAETKFQHLLDQAPDYHKIRNHWTLESLEHLFDKAISTDDDASFPKVHLRDNDPVFILYTSGTTGFPKGALYTHKMLFWNSINTSISLIVNSESRTINVMPPFHTGGWNVLTTPFFHHGGYTCLLKKFEPSSVLSLLQSEQVTLFMGVPTMLKMIADEPAFAQADFSSLHYIIVGGEPMPVPLIEKWHEKGVLIRQGYGMTEVGPNLTSLHQTDAVRKRGSIGRPNFYVDIKIVDEQGQECKPNQPGELLLRGPMVTPGYWRNRQATQKALEGGWFHTGDMVRQDEEQYIYVVDRIKNMFISGGENIYPAEIERVIVTHPAVAEVSIVGIPDEKWGEAGYAFVVLHAAAQLTEAELLDFCAARLARFKIPKNISFMEALPKNDTGKINRMALKGMV